MSTALVYTRGSERSSHLSEVIQPRVREPGQFEDSVEDGVDRNLVETRRLEQRGAVVTWAGPVAQRGEERGWGGEGRGGRGWREPGGSADT